MFITKPAKIVCWVFVNHHQNPPFYMIHLLPTIQSQIERFFRAIITSVNIKNVTRILLLFVNLLYSPNIFNKFLLKIYSCHFPSKHGKHFYPYILRNWIGRSWIEFFSCKRKYGIDLFSYFLWDVRASRTYWTAVLFVRFYLEMCNWFFVHLGWENMEQVFLALFLTRNLSSVVIQV